MAEAKDLLAVLDSNAGRFAELDAMDRVLTFQFERPYLPLNDATTYAREYNALITRSETPILNMLIDAQVDRLRVVGVRTDDAERPNRQVWGWWQDSSLDQGQTLLYRDSAGYGDGFLLVTPGDGATPRFSVESPLNLAVEFDPFEPVRVQRAAKVVGDSAWLYDDEAITSFTRQRSSTLRWEVSKIVPHAAGECPVVRYPNNLDSRGRSFSEVRPVLPVQARLNQSQFDRLLIQRSSSWRQRWATGLDIERDADGKPIAPFKAGPDTMLVNESPEGRFGEFLQVNLDPILKAIDADIAMAAMVTRTPPHYLPQATISSVSAEALVALEAAFSAKISEKQGLLGEQHERAMRIGGRMVGVEVSSRAEVVWADLEMRSLAQKTDAALKQRSIGFPMVTILEGLGFTDQKIDEILREQKLEAEAAAVAQARAFGVNGDGFSVAPE